ncbi:hypothetical protein [Thauera sp.]|jgi:hypothetical protein|uniref:hypothetical protein n=1 Tax=Thauera sp. TaxID=1905334 RepID=UPI002C4CE347|nr:hypothetical protein [Thauera sp.]HRO34656.1 hypothetical protein [Thauera sp.]
MEAPSTPSDAEQMLLRWLESEPADAVEDDLAALRAHMHDAFGSAGAGTNSELLSALAERIGDIGGRLRSLLLARQLPVEVSLFEANEQLCLLALDVATAIANAAGEAGDGRVALSGPAVELCEYAIGLVNEIFVLSRLAAAQPPAGTWRLAHEFAVRREVASLASEDPLRCAYLRLLAVAVAQPEGLTGREIAWLHDFLDARVLGAAGLASGVGDTSASAWWIDLGADLGPQAVARRPAPSGSALVGEVWSFNPRPMAQKLGECVEWVTARMTAAELAGIQGEVDPLTVEEGLFPPGLSPLETVALLRRLRSHWMAAPVRGQPRRQHQYVAQVGIGLQAVWDLGAADGHDPALVQEWMVLNESPGGLAIMSVAGVRGEIEAGGALALRRNPEQAWSVCIVRWVRSDCPGQVEVGLQIIGHSFHPVMVGFRGRAVQQLSPALALPVMEPLRRHPAMLAVAGTYASRRFVFVRELQTVYVAQARALGLDMQTPSVELFQYEIDPYPI